MGPGGSGGKRSFTGFDLQEQWGGGSDKRLDKEFFLRQ